MNYLEIFPTIVSIGALILVTIFMFSESCFLASARRSRVGEEIPADFIMARLRHSSERIIRFSSPVAITSSK